MTRKLFSSILSICLLFGSLYLPAQAQTQNQTPHALYSEAKACLSRHNLACAKVTLAKISSHSAYAKLLQGSIALYQQQLDESLSLLLPLQTEPNLIDTAKIDVHEYLANIFERIDDPHQALQHLITIEYMLPHSTSDNLPQIISQHQQKIWTLLNSLNQDQLLSIRGNNTDHNLQGWIDLSIAARNQDLAQSIAGWSLNYTDHPARTFGLSLTATSRAIAPQLISAHKNIAILLHSSSADEIAKANAFQSGLQSALNKYGLPNNINIYANTPAPDDNPANLDLAHQYHLAKQAGDAFLITLHPENLPDDVPPKMTEHIFHLHLALNEQTLSLIKFAKTHAIERILIIASEDAPSQDKVKDFQQTWQADADQNLHQDSLKIINLPSNIEASDTSLLELKSHIGTTKHDMILLTISARDTSIIKPHLDISTPTLAYADINDSSFEGTLNAIRFADIPFLLPSADPTFQDYHAEASALPTNELIRYFALGVDSLQLLSASGKTSDHAQIINGLTGRLSIQDHHISRQLPMARFTFDGITLE
ncbi:MAG: hypothetical protein CVU29_08070 [Betaproteobacteria bacterium HGW-Betaproteobacteria-22]|nr:MAG: hypothetical protein CVU29_08070 [Betaproteobacteria bacterium HGW-Betaproteobacteria-22]